VAGVIKLAVSNSGSGVQAAAGSGDDHADSGEQALPQEPPVSGEAAALLTALVDVQDVRSRQTGCDGEIGRRLAFAPLLDLRRVSGGGMKPC
jgi:hypothetical protein